MKNNILKIQLYLFLILLCVPIYAYAECTISSDGVKSEHYSNADCYDNKEFYQKSNPSDWNWNNVKWENVDFNDKRVYSAQGFYDNLPKEKYAKVNYKEADLAKLNQEFIDIGKFNDDIIPDKNLDFVDRINDILPK